jgi:hypothetical protein
MSELNFDKAVQLWIDRENGVPRKTIVAMYDIDPRRAYEVWKEEKFIGSREVALERAKALFPGKPTESLLRVHVERYRVVSKDPNQPDLFD